MVCCIVDPKTPLWVTVTRSKFQIPDISNPTKKRIRFECIRFELAIKFFLKIIVGTFKR